jgi:osmotically-inducible protein OsmY
MGDALSMLMRANKFAATIRNSGAAAVVMFVLFAAPIVAQQPATRDVTQQFVSAGVAIEDLHAVEVGGIVVLRGRTADRLSAEQAGSVAQSFGYTRVANLIQVAEAPDDARITRVAERELAVHRGMDGTRIAIDTTNGVVRLRGKVSNELQKDMAVTLVRNINGVRAVQIALQR